jgi:hypothetical protein
MGIADSLGDEFSSNECRANRENHYPITGGNSGLQRASEGSKGVRLKNDDTKDRGSLSP